MEAMAEAMRLISELPDDERLRHDVVDGETEALDCLDAYAQQAIADAALVKQARERAARLEARAERNRAIVCAILQGLQLKRAERALFTASISQRKELVEVPTNEELPERFVRKAPDKVAIKKELGTGERVPGYELQDKPGVTLTLRTG
jgi:hypothetical protein